MDGGAGPKRCRLCDGLYPVVPLGETFSEKVSNCFGFKISANDGLPKHICQKCKVIVNDLNEVIMSYQLRQVEIRNNFIKPLNSRKDPAANKSLKMQTIIQAPPSSLSQIQLMPQTTSSQLSQIKILPQSTSLVSQIQFTPQTTPSQLSQIQLRPQTTPSSMYQIQLMPQIIPPQSSMSQIQLMPQTTQPPLTKIQLMPATTQIKLISRTPPSPLSQIQLMPRKTPSPMSQIQLLPQTTSGSLQPQTPPTVSPDNGAASHPILLSHIQSQSSPPETNPPPVKSPPLQDQTSEFFVEVEKKAIPNFHLMPQEEAKAPQKKGWKIKFKCLICGAMLSDEEKLKNHAKEHDKLINMATTITKPCFVHMQKLPLGISMKKVDYNINPSYMHINERRIFKYDVTSPHSMYSFKTKLRLDANGKYLYNESIDKKPIERPMQKFSYKDTRPENPTSTIDLSKSAKPKISVSNSDIINIVLKFLSQADNTDLNMFNDWRPKRCSTSLFQKVIKKNRIRVSWTAIENGTKIPVWCNKQKKQNLPLDLLSASLVNHRKNTGSNVKNGFVMTKKVSNLKLVDEKQNISDYSGTSLLKPNSIPDKPIASDNDDNSIDCEVSYVQHIPESVSELVSVSPKIIEDFIESYVMKPTSKRKNTSDSMLNQPNKIPRNGEVEMIPKIIDTFSIKPENPVQSKPLIKCKPTQELMASSSPIMNPNSTPYSIQQNVNSNNPYLIVFPNMNVMPNQVPTSLPQSVSLMNQCNIMGPSTAHPNPNALNFIPNTIDMMSPPNINLYDYTKQGELYRFKELLFTHKINFEFLTDSLKINYPLKKIVKFKIVICEDYSNMKKNSVFTVTLSMDQIATFILDVMNDENQREELSIWPKHYHQQLLKAFKQDAVIGSLEKMIKHTENRVMVSKVMTFLFLLKSIDIVW